MKDLIKRLEKANIIGRGGAEYPAFKKWMAVRDAPKKPKYVICNSSEREPDTQKDFFILSQHGDRVFFGMELAIDAVGATEGIINLNGEYHKKLKKEIEELVAESAKGGYKYKILIFDEDPSYIGGEETALLNAIEGKRCEPRLKPPFPTEAGLYGCPTLIHNVETLYDIACVEEGTYEGKRFFTISGAVKHPGVFHLPADWTILEVLKETENVPTGGYFAQVGGGASGVVLNAEQLATEKAHGAASVIVHLLEEKPRDLVLKWLTFYQQESCGKCTPCREGTYQLLKMVKESKKVIPWQQMQPLLAVLEKSSFCALGRSVPVPLRSYLKNVLQHD